MARRHPAWLDLNGRFRSGRITIAGLVFCAAFLCAAKAEARQPWTVFSNCQLIENDADDADSFHVQAAGREYIFRLYFVDAPETDAGFPGRVEEQAKYFALSPVQTIQLGIAAKKFTDEKLSQPFSVRTCRQDALGRSKTPRFYAFVETKEGDLGELLVANGLARVHGIAAPTAGWNSAAQEKQKLVQLEMEAKRQRVGGWGAGSGRMMARALTKRAAAGQDPFDAFFHPATAKVATPSSTLPPRTSTVEPAITTNEKLDPNTATADELIAIKGIGPVLADRIIAARPYRSADELQKAKGIGPKIYAKIRPYFANPPAVETPTR